MENLTAGTKKPTSIKLFGLLILIVVLIIGAGAWLISRQLSTDQVYKYKKFDSYTLGSGPSISFTKPVELKQISKTQDEAELQHVIKTKGSHRGIDTDIVVTFVVTDVSLSQSQIQSINEVLQKPKVPAYSTYTRNIITFLNANSPPGWKNNLSSAKQFTNNNIKTGAWEFNFTSSYQNLVDKGEILYMVGGKVNYYFLILSTDKNWDYNQQAWSQVLDSLKINS